MPASENVFKEAVIVKQPHWLITINGGCCTTLAASVINGKPTALVNCLLTEAAAWGLAWRGGQNWCPPP